MPRGLAVRLALIIAFTLGAAWWTVQAARRPRDPVRRSVAFCLILACATYAFAVPENVGSLAALAGDSRPRHDAFKVGQHASVMSFAYALMCFFLYSSGTPRARRSARRHGLVLVLAVGTVAALGLWAPHGALSEAYDAADTTQPSVFGFYALTAVYLVFALSASCRWTQHHARAASRPHATGLWLVTWGLGAMTVASAAHAVGMACRALGAPAPWTPEAVALLGLSAVTFAAGVIYPAARIRASLVRLWYRRRRAYRRLEPLWRLLTDTYPDLAGGSSASVRSSGSVHFRLHRRVIECRDGLVRISPALRGAGAVSVLEDLPPDDLARRLRRACRSGPALSTRPAHRVAIPGQDRRSEVAQLMALSDAVRQQERADVPEPASDAPPVRSGVGSR